MHHDASASEGGAILSIDLGAIVANWRDLSARARPAETGAVVKADAYGCGVEPVVAALSKAGCATFFVAQIQEARRVRESAPDAIIYVLNGLTPESAPAFAELNARPVLGSMPEWLEWNAFVAAQNWRGACALHVDTGMNRLGLRLDDAADLTLQELQSANVALLMSHFVSSEIPAHPMNAKQMGVFRDLRARFPGIPGSLANSSGIFLGPDALHDVVRPGIALYGGNPTPEHLNLMRPVVQLDARIIQVRIVPEGETVGYGATWRTKRRSRIAVVSLGYADGYPRAASASDLKPGTDALIAGHRAPLAGRVSMDLIAIDATDVPEAFVQRGAFATFIGGGISISDVASRAGTISYEVLTHLGRRFKRIYHGA